MQRFGAQNTSSYTVPIGFVRTSLDDTCVPVITTSFLTQPIAALEDAQRSSDSCSCHSGPPPAATGRAATNCFSPSLACHICDVNSRCCPSESISVHVRHSSAIALVKRGVPSPISNLGHSGNNTCAARLLEPLLQLACSPEVSLASLASECRSWAVVLSFLSNHVFSWL